MRIFIDARPVPGGIQRCLDELVRRLRAHASDVDLVVYREAGAGRAPVRLESKRRSRMRQQLGDLKRIFEDRVLLPNRVRGARCEVLVSPNGMIPAGIGCRSVLLCHDLWLLDRPDTKREGFISAYERSALIKALDRADRIVVPSRSVQNELVDRMPQLAARVRQIYHPLPELHVAQQPAPQPTQQPPALPPLLESSFLLTVGTLEPRKNLERLIDAQRESWPRTGVPLVLVGPYGWRQTALLEAVERTAGVSWLGAVDEGTLDRLYRRAAAVVQVSLCEGFSYPMVEAMQRETALVLSDLPVHREIAGTCATFCDARNRDSISAAIEEVLGLSSEKQTARRASARKGLDRLSDERFVGRWLALFEELGSDPEPAMATGQT